VKSPASSTINQGRCHHSMHGHFIPPPHCAPDHFFLSVKSPSLTAAYAPAKKPMKLEPIVMIHGGSISDTTPMSMSRACSTAPPNVPPSQKKIQTTRMSVLCRASFIAPPQKPGPGYNLQAALAKGNPRAPEGWDADRRIRGLHDRLCGERLLCLGAPRRCGGSA